MTKHRHKSRFEEELYKKKYRVAIFGSARIKPKDPTYKMIYKLASLIAEENIDVVTGGGPGLMQAANAGHRAVHTKKDVQSIGLAIKLPKEQAANRHLDLKKHFNRFSLRLDHFMYLSNLVIVAPGGIGTTLELFYTWQLLQVKHIQKMPIILLGDMWFELIDWIKKGPLKKGMISREDLNHIYFAKNPEEAMVIIRKFHHEFLMEAHDYVNVEIIPH